MKNKYIKISFRSKAFLFLAFIIFILVFAQVSLSQETPNPTTPQKMVKPSAMKVFIFENLSTDNQLSIETFEPTTNPIKIFDLSSIDITAEGISYLQKGFLRKYTPNFKLELLKLGYASIKVDSTASSEEKKAQEEAKKSGVGKWVKPNENWDWNSIFENLQKNFPWILGILFAAGSFYGGKPIIDFMIKFLMRRSVSFIMLGLGSSGKSWILA